MRDAMKNFRMIIKGKMPEESDSESEPLLSSVNSHRSFGAAETPIFSPDSESSELDIETSRQKAADSSTSSIVTSTPISSTRRWAKRLLFPTSFDTPEVDIITDSQKVFDIAPDYAKIAGTLPSGDSFIKDAKNVDDKDKSHSSLVTIFAIWNTTMGSSLLAMSWGLERSGLFPGIFITLFIGAISLYTAYVIVKVNEKHGMLGQINEMPDLCRLLIGRWAEILAKIFSLVVLTGANIVYWILMSNFLFNTVVVLYGYIFLAVRNQYALEEAPSVICPKEMIPVNESILVTNESVLSFTRFNKIWDLYSTVPIFLAVLMFPLLNFKSATFFTKFNSLGTISVIYILIFVLTKACIWGINLPDIKLEFYVKPSFSALSGMLSLSYFIHNIIISIMRHNRNPQHNGRDLSIAFGLVTFTYLFMGIVFYIAYPLAKRCIEDNILNNLERYDTMTIIARILLLFQLFTVFPLISYMLRNDILSNIKTIFKKDTLGNFTYGKVVVLNFIVVLICILFACFMPRIGTLIRYTGALSGMVYIYMLPSLLMIASLRKENALTMFKLVFYVTIIVIGGFNLGSQFLISD